MLQQVTSVSLILLFIIAHCVTSSNLISEENEEDITPSVETTHETAKLKPTKSSEEKIPVTPSTVDEVLAYCLYHYNKSCSCLRRYGTSVQEFSCTGFKYGSRCRGKGCEVCRRSSTISSCGFSGFFNGCKKECLCSCATRYHLEQDAFPHKIKCGEWCDGRAHCPNGQDERGHYCRIKHRNMFTKIGNLIWLLGCGVLVYYIFKRREALSAWMNHVNNRNPSYQAPTEQHTVDTEEEEVTYFGRQGNPPPNPRYSLPQTNDHDTLLPPSYEEISREAGAEPPSINNTVSPPPSYEESTKDNDNNTTRTRT